MSVSTYLRLESLATAADTMGLEGAGDAVRDLMDPVWDALTAAERCEIEARCPIKPIFAKIADLDPDVARMVANVVDFLTEWQSGPDGTPRGWWHRTIERDLRRDQVVDLIVKSNRGNP